MCLSTSVERLLPKRSTVSTVPEGWMAVMPTIICVPGNWVIPAGFQATAEGSSARATMPPARAVPRAPKSDRVMRGAITQPPEA